MLPSCESINETAMRGTIRWRLHVPGEKSTEEEHADDPDAENAGVLEKDTTQCLLESEDEEDERMRVENGAAHDATVYAHSVTHSSDAWCGRPKHSCVRWKK
mmetsp:Transcript_18571/g.27939  ORF Transcript_18571/g.27939 Transcript_18571/m.27939 type:complete len:102 (+) Transcript_18571:91-396(+)